MKKAIIAMALFMMMIAVSARGAERTGILLNVYPQVNNTYLMNNYTIHGGGAFWDNIGSYLKPNGTVADDVNISAGWLYVEENITGGAYINAQIECSNIVGGDDGDFCSDATGSSFTDTNASTACTGTNVYLDGEGNCDMLSDLGNFTDIGNEYQQDITGGCELNQTVIGIVDGGAIGCNYISITEAQISDLGTYQLDIGSDCSANNYVYGVENDGTLLCREDQAGTGSGTDTNATTACGDGEVLLGDDAGVCVDLNATIDNRDTDTNTMCNTAGNCATVYVGTGEGNNYINFYNGGSPTGAQFYWNDGGNYFETSQALRVGAQAIINGDLYTISSGEDLWLGNSNQASANFRAYASGAVYGTTATFTTLNGALDCGHITGNVTDLCSITPGGGSGTDTNATTACGDGEVLMGDDAGICLNLNDTIDDRDTDTNTMCDTDGNCELVYAGQALLTGNTEETSGWCAYEDGDPYGECILWDNSGDYFTVSDQTWFQDGMFVTDDVYVQGDFSAESSLRMGNQGDTFNWFKVNDTGQMNISYYQDCDLKTDPGGLVICGTDEVGEGGSGTDTNASTACSGDTTYLSGEGNCNDISSVYFDNYADFMGTTTSGKLCRWDGSEIDCDYTDDTGTDDQTCAEVSGCVVGASTYDASDDLVDDCTEANACTIDAESMEGVDWGTMTNGYYCKYDSASTEVDCATQYPVGSDLTCTNCIGGTEIDESTLAISTANNITTSNVLIADEIYIGGASGWRIYVNGTGQLKAQAV